MKDYAKILQTIINEGTIKPNRTGEDTLSLFHYSYKIDISDKFPLLTGKKINFDNILFELLWFLSGDSSPDFLHKHGIKFWDEWIEEDGNLPEAYGEYWRDYPHSIPTLDEIHGRMKGFDQFGLILKEIRTNPNSRRMVMTNWYPPSAWKAKLPPCHLTCIFNVQYDVNKNPYLNLEMLQRSADVPVGVPFNIASYTLLLKLVGHLVDLPVKYFAHTLVDVHMYVNQTKGVNKYLSRIDDFPSLPTLEIENINCVEDLDSLIINGSTEQIKSCFKLEGYNPLSFIKFPIMV